MTIGPAPMMRMVWMSVRLGMAVLGCCGVAPQGGGEGLVGAGLQPRREGGATDSRF